MADMICSSLLLDPQERSEILRDFSPTRTEVRRAKKKTDEVDSSYLQLTADQFRVVSEWYYFAILSLVKTADFQSNSEWIAQRLGISVPQVNQAIDRLERLGLIENERGRIHLNQTRYRTTDDVMNLSVRKSHFETLELAKQSLEQNAIEERDFSSITMAVDVEQLAQAKSLIRKFQDDLDALLEGDEQKQKSRTEVYRLAVQLFPLTKLKRRNEK